MNSALIDLCKAIGLDVGDDDCDVQVSEDINSNDDGVYK